MNTTQFAAATGLALCLSLAPATQAQIEEVMVTALKREQSAQDLGMSVAVFDEAALRELGTGTLARIADVLPGVEALAPGSQIQTYHIRGVGLNEFAGNFDAPVAIHVDEVYISKAWMLTMPVFDIARVEALKGPQGTLFGRNVTGGAVNQYTHAPTSDFDASVETAADQHQRYSVAGFVNGALTPRLAGRLSAHIGFGDGGPWHNLYTGEDVGAQDVQVLRGQLLWHNEATAVRLLVHRGRDRGDSQVGKGPGIFTPGLAGFCPELLAGAVVSRASSCLKFGGFAADPATEREPDDPFTINQDYWPHRNNTSLGGYARVEHDFSAATLTSITAYEAFERDERDDPSFGPLVDGNLDQFTDIGQFSQELRLSGEPVSRWRYVAGLAFAEEHLSDYVTANVAGHPFSFLPPDAPRAGAQLEQDVRSTAAFWHNEIRLYDRLTATAALRWTEEEVDVNGSTFLGADDPRGNEDFVTPVIVVDTVARGRNDHDLSWRLGLDWSVAPGRLLYATASTGFRGGGFSVPIAGFVSEFDAEEMLALEAGVKTTLLDDTLQFNAAAYYYNYDQVQINVDDETAAFAVPVTENIGTSKARGLEADVLWSPGERWDLRGAIAYLNAEYTDTTKVVSTYNGVIPLLGKSPINAPRWTASARARHTRPLTPQLNLVLGTNVRFTDERFLEPTNQIFDKASAYWLVSARAAIVAADGRWEIALRGENVFDEAYLTYINNFSIQKADAFGLPATWTATLRYRFQ